MDRICLPPACAARYAEAHRFVLLDQRPRAAPLTEAAVVFGRESEGGHEDDKPTNERTKVVNAKCRNCHDIRAHATARHRNKGKSSKLR